MNSLISIDSQKPEKRKLKMRFKVLLCILIVFIILILLYNLINLFKQNNENRFIEKNINTSENTQIDSETEIQKNPKTSFIKKMKESFSIQIYNIINSKNQATLAEEQYNRIINIYDNSSEKTVYLTFDDGPSETVTPLILDLLKQENIKVTFFVLGVNTDIYPQIVQREYSEGHFIANHGYSHKYSEIYENTETILNDYNQCEQAIKKALNNENYTTKVYRFPGGSNGGKYHEVKAQGKEILKENNIAYLDWNALTFDAEGTPTHESILQNLAETVKDKNTVVLLMHDSSSKILTYETLPEVISFFRERGYNFKTLYDILY